MRVLFWLPSIAGSPQADVTGVDSTWASATGEFADFDKLWTG